MLSKWWQLSSGKKSASRISPAIVSGRFGYHETCSTDARGLRPGLRLGFAALFFVLPLSGCWVNKQQVSLRKSHFPLTSYSQRSLLKLDSQKQNKTKTWMEFLRHIGFYCGVYILDEPTCAKKRTSPLFSFPQGLSFEMPFPYQKAFLLRRQYLFKRRCGECGKQTEIKRWQLRGKEGGLMFCLIVKDHEYFNRKREEKRKENCDQNIRERCEEGA